MSAEPAEPPECGLPGHLYPLTDLNLHLLTTGMPGAISVGRCTAHAPAWPRSPGYEHQIVPCQHRDGEPDG